MAGTAAGATSRDAVVDVRSLVGDVPVFLGDVVRLLGRLLVDPRVPRSAKLVVAGTVAYAVGPWDVVPDSMPLVGAIDELWMAASAVRRLVRAAGYEVVREHWDGDGDSFGVLLVLAGVER